MKKIIGALALVGIGFALWAWPRLLVEEMAWTERPSDSGALVTLVFKQHPYWIVDVLSQELLTQLQKTKPATVTARFRVSRLFGMRKLLSVGDWEAKDYTLGVTDTCGAAPLAACGEGKTYPETPSPFHPHSH